MLLCCCCCQWRCCTSHCCRLPGLFGGGRSFTNDLLGWQQQEDSMFCPNRLQCSCESGHCRAQHGGSRSGSDDGKCALLFAFMKLYFLDKIFPKHKPTIQIESLFIDIIYGAFKFIVLTDPFSRMAPSCHFGTVAHLDLKSMSSNPGP